MQNAVFLAFISFFILKVFFILWPINNIRFSKWQLNHFKHEPEGRYGNPCQGQHIKRRPSDEIYTKPAKTSGGTRTRNPRLSSRHETISLVWVGGRCLIHQATEACCHNIFVLTLSIIKCVNYTSQVQGYYRIIYNTRQHAVFLSFISFLIYLEVFFYLVAYK